MSPQPLPVFCQTLAAAPDLRGALAALYAEMVANDPGLELALFTYDARKGLLTSRLVRSPPSERRLEVDVEGQGRNERPGPGAARGTVGSA